MKNKIFVLLVVFILSSCTNNDEFFNEYKNQYTIQNGSITLNINLDLSYTIQSSMHGTPLNEKQDNTSDFILANNVKVANFQIDKKSISSADINDEYGNGKQFVFEANSEGNTELQIRKILKINLYTNYPDVVFFQTKYINSGNSKITINKIISNDIVLDASKHCNKKKAYEFWSYQGAAVNWGDDYITSVTDSTSEENYMGEKPDSKMGGGNPIVDLWNEDFGIALAHIDTVPRLISIPVKVRGDKRVSIKIVENKEIALKPGDSISSIPSILIAHKLDYFSALQSYSNIMKAKGVYMKKPSGAAYEPIWCSWGYGFNFTSSDIINALPKIKKFDIDWVVLDDRWFDKYGDWNVRKDNFPDGEEEMKKLVNEIHKQGLKAKIWWLPTAIQGTDKPPIEKNWIKWDFSISDLAQKHPEWLIKDKQGNYCTDSRYLWNLCPAVPEVQQYIKETTEKFINDWDFDGIKLDAYYVVPPCYNPLHNHKRPEESFEKLPELFKIIYETTKELKPDAVVELCNCGVPQDFYQSVWTDQPVTSDPLNALQVRRRIKSMKALWGISSPVYADQIEFTNGDFASALGTGGVLGTKFTYNNGPEDVLLNTKKEKIWEKWFKLYKEKMLAKGEYLNLYDVIFDKPETHVIRKGDTLFYAFFQENWNDTIELRGLENNSYRIIDYENNIALDTINSNIPIFKCTFKNHLLIELIPVK